MRRDSRWPISTLQYRRHRRAAAVRRGAGHRHDREQGCVRRRTPYASADPRRVALAIAGLSGLVLPGLAAPLPITSAVLMIIAGIAWGSYSLRGAQVPLDPLNVTAGNFLRTLPMTLIFSLIFFTHMQIDPLGFALCRGLRGRYFQALAMPSGTACFRIFVPRRPQRCNLAYACHRCLGRRFPCWVNPPACVWCWPRSPCYPASRW